MLSDATDFEPKDLTCKPEQILQGAMQVFLQYGYAGTSMDRVAAEAGVSKHTIYNHFLGKEGLFSALIERLIIRHFQLEFGGDTLPQDVPPAQVLRRIAKTFLSRMDDPEYIAFLRLMIAESGRFPELAQLYNREVILRGDQFFQEYLQGHPALKIADTTMVSRIFFGALAAFILSQEVLHGKQVAQIERDRLIDHLITLLFIEP